MKNKRRLYLSVDERDLKLFKELLLLIKETDKSFTEAELFSALMYHFCMASKIFYEKYTNKGEEKDNAN